MKVFTGPDGTPWSVELGPPGASNALILFRHPDGRTSGRDRYNWLNWPGGESQNVTARLEPDRVLGALGDGQLARLFFRSMPVSTIR
jgi:hypothetical protein